MKEHSLGKINYFLILLLCGILFVIIFVSAFVLCSKPEDKINEYRKVDNPVNLQKSVDYSVFSDFGRLRTFTADNPQIPVVVLPFISYKTENSFLYEELCQKQRKIRTIILQFFTQKTQKELFSMGEEIVKSELLTLINEELAMGKIEALYFEEYIFLE
ncbi:MAG: flagellar basal body-associated FliL family protein [Spirochaetaceae bacterium]|nr:flagellar basal body-associated FliL family protein [Spirochaetaceae bacterium]